MSQQNGGKDAVSRQDAIRELAEAIMLLVDVKYREGQYEQLFLGQARNRIETALGLLAKPESKP